MAGSDRSYDPGEASHRALRGIERELERHPIVTEVRGFPAGEFTQLVAQLETKRLDFDREDATLTVRWFAGETVEARPEFSFHYSDDRTDFGWYHEPNPHVDGWGISRDGTRTDRGIRTTRGRFHRTIRHDSSGRSCRSFHPNSKLTPESVEADP